MSGARNYGRVGWEEIETCYQVEYLHPAKQVEDDWVAYESETPSPLAALENIERLVINGIPRDEIRVREVLSLIRTVGAAEVRARAGQA